MTPRTAVVLLPRTSLSTPATAKPTACSVRHLMRVLRARSQAGRQAERSQMHPRPIRAALQGMPPLRNRYDTKNRCGTAPQDLALDPCHCQADRVLGASSDASAPSPASSWPTGRALTDAAERSQMHPRPIRCPTPRDVTTEKPRRY